MTEHFKLFPVRNDNTARTEREIEDDDMLGVITTHTTGWVGHLSDKADDDSVALDGRDDKVSRGASSEKNVTSLSSLKINSKMSHLLVA